MYLDARNRESLLPAPSAVYPYLRGILLHTAREMTLDARVNLLRRYELIASYARERHSSMRPKFFLSLKSAYGVTARSTAPMPPRGPGRCAGRAASPGRPAGPRKTRKTPTDVRKEHVH